MDRISYLIRRMLLVIPTFIGITIVCFSLTRFLPGGPVEIRMMRLKGLGAQSGETSGASSASASGGSGRAPGFNSRVKNSWNVA